MKIVTINSNNQPLKPWPNKIDEFLLQQQDTMTLTIFHFISEIVILFITRNDYTPNWTLLSPITITISRFAFNTKVKIL